VKARNDDSRLSGFDPFAPKRGKLFTSPGSVILQAWYLHCIPALPIWRWEFRQNPTDCQARGNTL